jgi:hypothetical protein
MTGRLWTALLPLASVFAVHGPQCAADGGHPTATTAAGDRGTGEPHESAGHLRTVCLAVLATALVMLLPALLPRPAQLFLPAHAHARARLRLAPARTPDLSALYLLRI